MAGAALQETTIGIKARRKGTNMTERTVGMQLIIFGKQIKEDLGGVLDAVARAGYQAVETGFLADQVKGSDFRKMLSDRGLKHVGVHFGGERLGEVQQIIDWLGETGGTDIPVSDLRTRENSSPDIYQQCADEYNKAGEICRKAGITLSYHNHSWEFADVGGKPGLEVLYEKVDPNLVKACIDTYWVRDGAADPAAFVAKYADRLRILHMKDSFLEERGKRSFCPVGEGILDWKSIMKATEGSPCRWLVVEEDGPREGKTAEGESTSSRTFIREKLGF